MNNTTDTEFDCTICGAEGAVIITGTAPDRVAKCDECGAVSFEGGPDEDGDE